MFPYASRHSSADAARAKVRALQRAATTFRQTEQPRLYGHVHPHGHATAKLARAFAALLAPDCPPRALDEVELGAHLHDIGKYLIPESILFKAGALTDEEREVVSFHPAYGAHILKGLPGVTDTIHRIVLCHHERWDGWGYPAGLDGARIPFAARLVAVCDVYTSLRARRPYKPPLPRRAALATLEAMAGRELDPTMVEAFRRLLAHARRHAHAFRHASG
ncbi:MAG: HD domain-containing protein [Acidobacteria bacterium]|nr:HD domain-containing protein [Acidobacteriota bacterium]